MSKEALLEIFNGIQTSGYAWTLYFFKINRKLQNHFKVHKIRFKNPQYLKDYIYKLAFTVKSFQIESINDVQEYDGYNTKISCDKLMLSSDLLSTQWINFQHSVANATDEKLNGKINGYILAGQPQSLQNTKPPVVMVRVANPVINFKNPRFTTFKSSEEDALELFSDELYRLYLTVDFVVFNQYLYTFNHSFEKVYDIESTLLKVKNNAVEKILATNCVADLDSLRVYLSQHKNPRTFISLNALRLESVSQKASRKKIAEKLNIPMDKKGLLTISDMDKASLLIKFLCYKIFEESETKDILEASTVNKVQI